MKKLNIFNIFAILAACGIGVSLISFFALGASISTIVNAFNEDNKYTLYEQTFEANDTCSGIDIDVSNRAIHFMSSNTNEIKITYYVSEKDNAEFSASDADNGIKLEIKRKLITSINLNIIPFWTSSKLLNVTVSLPSTFIKPISVNTTNGKIRLENISSSTINLKTSNGEINLENVVAQKIDAVSSNGEISLKNVQCADDVYTKTSNGEIVFESLDCGSVVYAKSSNGEIIAKHTQATKLDFNTSDGYIDLSNVDSKEVILKTSNGKIEVNKLKTDNLSAVTSNGRITLHLDDHLSDYSFDLKTSNGKILINNSKNADKLVFGSGSSKIYCKTSNGNIVINSSH